MKKHNVRSSYQSEEISQRYEKERFTSIIGKVVDHIERQHVLKALRLCGAQEGEYVCDMACGTGRITETLIESGMKTIGVDYSLAMLKEANQKEVISKRGVGLVAMDACKLGFRDNAFSYSTAMRFFGHIPSEERIKVLSELKRITNKKIIVAYYHIATAHTLYRLMRYALKGTFYGHLVTRKMIEKEAKITGLRIVKMLPFARFFHQGNVVILEVG